MKSPRNPPSINDLLARIEPDRLAEIFRGNRIDAAPGGRYYHWDQLRHRPPPTGLSSEEWWLSIKLARQQGRRSLPLTNGDGQPFSYVLTDEALSLLLRIDQQTAGRVGIPEDVVNARDRTRYLVSGLMEEAIASSLLEGAATTRRDAKNLLRSNRSPRTPAERMVVNNYQTMTYISRDPEAPLTGEMVLEIHRMVTEGTLNHPEDAGRMQQPGEERVIVGHFLDPDPTYHVPPPAEELPGRMEYLVSFANDLESEPFVHPVVRAIALHFYLAYLHPFVDGNGRTARALFYRSLLRQGYWLAEYLSISRLLRRAPVQYGKAFLHTETDDADFTYFLLHQLEVLDRSIEELWRYLDARADEIRRAEQALRGSPDFNHRQIALLSRTLRRPDDIYTMRSYQTTHGVAYPTAHSDLTDLYNRGLLDRHKVGKQYRFVPVTKRLLKLFDNS